MTNNEKAATFIGWEPYTCDDGHCDFCGSRALPHHPAKSPDMSDPRNYMQALAAASEGHYVSLVWLDGHHCANIFRDRNALVIIGQGEPVEALAALYDAEHPAS